MVLAGDTTLTFMNAVVGQSITLFLTQDNIGSRLVTFPSINGQVVLLQLFDYINLTDIFTIIYNGTDYFGVVNGIGF